MKSGNFNCIAIIDCIPEGELNTARILKETLQDLFLYKKELENLSVKYYRAENKDSLINCMSTIKGEVNNNKLLPWIHIDGHGLDDLSGIKLPNCTHCTWIELKKLITPINIATNLNVVLVLATCFGGNFATSIDTTDRAPILTLIGPKEEIKVSEIEKYFPMFYEKLFNTKSFNEAIRILNTDSTNNSYYITYATNFFYDVWVKYKNEMCTKNELRRRAKKIRKFIKKQRVVTPGVASIERLYSSSEKNIFDKYRDRYFMYDINGYNHLRFDVSYEYAQKLVNKSK